MSTTVRMRPVTGETVTWTGSNIEEVQAIAGEKFVGVHDTLLHIKGPAGEDAWGSPGFAVTRWDIPEEDVAARLPGAQAPYVTLHSASAVVLMFAEDGE